jgi:amino acid transporter
MNVASDSKIVFGYFYNLVTIFGLLTWVSILTTHIYFVRARKAQGIPESALAYRAPFGAAGSAFALFWCVVISLTKNFDVFTKGSYGNFNYKNFITGYVFSPSHR